MIAVLGSWACVGGNPAVFEPGTNVSRKAVTVGGTARSTCLGEPPVRNTRVRLVNAEDKVYAEDLTGVDGSFILRTRQIDEQLYLAVGPAKIVLPPPGSLWSEGSYRATFSVNCGDDDKLEPTPKPAEPKMRPASERAPARPPPAYLQPKTPVNW